MGSVASMEDWPTTGYERPGVDVALVREAFERTGMTKGELANRLGWTRPNVDRVNRALGYRPDTRGRSVARGEARQRMTYQLAEQMAEAMGVDPVDVGA